MAEITRRPIYDFLDYKTYLQELVGPARKRTGTKAAIARALRCQATYISQVLHGSAHLSLEQAELLADHLGLTPEEKHFLLLLVQRARAGTHSLAKYFDDQLEQIRLRRLSLTGRLGARQSLTADQQARYYSSWLFGAIHMAVTIPEFRTIAAISRLLNLAPKRVAQVLEDLSEMGLVHKGTHGFEPAKTTMRLGNESHNIIKHHTNWRQQAIESLEHEQITDLHYSAVISLSRADTIVVKDRFLEFIRGIIETVRASPEEELRCINLDFFDLKKTR